MQYELLYLVGESKETDIERIKREVSEIFTQEGAQWVEPLVERKRRLAYPVKHQARGMYVAQRFNLAVQEDSEDNEDKKDALEEMKTKLNLYSDVLRFIIVKADHLPEISLYDPKDKTAKTEPVRRQEKPAFRKERPKPPVKAAPKETKETSEDKAKINKDIDDKLEEILNI